jgi:hypothetical protein
MSMVKKKMHAFQKKYEGLLLRSALYQLPGIWRRPGTLEKPIFRNRVPSVVEKL